MGSMGGLVTTATTCLKYLLSGGRAGENTASGRSKPIEVIGSLPFSAMYLTVRTRSALHANKLRARRSGLPPRVGIPARAGSEVSFASASSEKLIGDSATTVL